MGTLTFQFSTSLELSSAIIRRVCHSEFSHCDLVLPDGNLLGASNSPDAPIVRGNPNGVAIRPPHYQLFGVRRNAIVRSEKADEFLVWSHAQLGKPFDDGALWAFLSDKPCDRNWREPEKWFCTEMYVAGLDVVGHFPYPLIVAKDRVSPADFLLILNPFIINVESFNRPIEGLKLGVKER